MIAVTITIAIKYTKIGMLDIFAENIIPPFRSDGNGDRRSCVKNRRSMTEYKHSHGKMEDGRKKGQTSKKSK